ncbi:hypothetical protein Pd630_LPD09210 (plasmid) [Rhodococcus opacus PD630]|nr:hypothetical protein Pd630_LPD09210 [Rhodococcus opacus PD630]
MGSGVREGRRCGPRGGTRVGSLHLLPWRAPGAGDQRSRRVEADRHHLENPHTGLSRPSPTPMDGSSTAEPGPNGLAAEQLGVPFVARGGDNVAHQFRMAAS